MQELCGELACACLQLHPGDKVLLALPSDNEHYQEVMFHFFVVPDRACLIISLSCLIDACLWSHGNVRGIMPHMPLLKVATTSVSPLNFHHFLDSISRISTICRNYEHLPFVHVATDMDSLCKWLICKFGLSTSCFGLRVSLNFVNQCYRFCSVSTWRKSHKMCTNIFVSAFKFMDTLSETPGTLKNTERTVINTIHERTTLNTASAWSRGFIAQHWTGIWRTYV